MVEIRFLPPSASDVGPKNALAERAARQLERYRDDPDATFDLPVVVEGSPLQRAVWDAMCAIPRGKTRTYGDIARELGAIFRALPAFPRCARVGQACGDNRLPIVIPCHRVVAADGIGGFGHATGGYLLEVKRWLLMHEAPAFELRPKQGDGPARRVLRRALARGRTFPQHLAAYRADLEQLGCFLKGKNCSRSREENLFAFLASRKGRASSAARLRVDAQALLPLLPARAAHRGRPDAQARPAQARAALPEVALRSRRRGAARRARRRRRRSACATARCSRRSMRPGCASPSSWR